MTLEQVTYLFHWMTIIGIGILLFSSLMLIMMKGAFTKLHSKLFGIDERHVQIMAYGYLGVFKAILLVFVVIPYVALLIVG